MASATRPARIGVILEHRFARDSEGNVWTRGTYDYTFWRRYLEVFDEVHVCARMSLVEQPDPSWRSAAGPNVSFHEVPDFTGTTGYLKQFVEIYRAVRNWSAGIGAAIIRTPGLMALTAGPVLVLNRTAYAVEVVGDPWDVFSPGAIHHWSRPLARSVLTINQKLLCRSAAAASYVTRSALQKRYPATTSCTAHYSSVNLGPDDFATAPRRFDPASMPFRLVITASLYHNQKGVDTLLYALHHLRSEDVWLQLTIIGDGIYAPNLKRLSNQLGLDEQVEFTGALPAGSAVCDVLDRADLFVLPSRQEGLPRSMIEAMARALPCLGTPVGGIPELLPPECIFPVNDPLALAAKISAVVKDPRAMSLLSARNLAAAAEYSADTLQQRRREYYHQFNRILAARANAAAG